jgi:hypothetical protein
MTRPPNPQPGFSPEEQADYDALVQEGRDQIARKEEQHGVPPEDRISTRRDWKTPKDKPRQAKPRGGNKGKRNK